MSTVNVVNSTENQFHADYDVSKIFVWKNRYEKGTLNNAGGAAADFAAGTLLGKVTASGKLIPLVSGAADGSQIPVGILKTAVTQLGAGADATVNYCVFGDVVESKVILDGGDTMDTVIAGRTIKDRIMADTMGIKLVASAELSEFDNQ